jgi:two-component system sensor histidine kinase VicK
LENINLLEVANKIVINKQLVLEEKRIKIQNNIDEEYTINADKLQLKELFDNLITNAIKFTPENGVIKIDAKKDKHFTTVSIKDTGIGMTEEEIDRIFDEFYKVDPSRHDLESSGLGLPICKRIVEKHGGHIWVESPGPNRGCNVCFTIPVNKKENINL